MRSPKDMRVIQIDITNACVHQCSNCTRFCGHHRTPFFMNWETFQKAVDSLQDFDHCIGIMGGEPTLHPQFERFAKYLAERHCPDYPIRSTRKPIVNFPRYIRDKNYFLDECLNDCKGIGLWTSVTPQYYRNFELIQDVFTYQSINDHNNLSLHQPLLVSRKEMGINDHEWIQLRDKCMIQNMWSASITPKGAFFCEVAAALDILLDGPGGWPLETDWWRREPKDFGYQLRWCELCGGALFHSGRPACEQIDDVSPLLYKKLQVIDSPKIKSGRVRVMDLSNPQQGQVMPDTRNRYLTDYNERVSKENHILFSDKITAVVICHSVVMLVKKLNQLQETFDRIVIFTFNPAISDKLKKIVIGRDKVKVLALQENSFGRTMNKAINLCGSNWLCLMAGELNIPESLISRIKNVVLNPGVLYSIPSADQTKFFHTEASALRNACYDGISTCDSLNMFYNLWAEDKQGVLEKDFDVLQNPDLEEWHFIAKKADTKNKSKVLKALDKIKSDYEREG